MKLWQCLGKVRMEAVMGSLEGRETRSKQTSQVMQ